MGPWLIATILLQIAVTFLEDWVTVFYLALELAILGNMVGCRIVVAMVGGARVNGMPLNNKIKLKCEVET
jgi:hypothetical protein